MKTIVLICIVVFCMDTFSQNDYRPGYIITKEGKEIHGLIDYRPNFSNFNFCYFKPDSLAETTRYTPHQLKGYRLTDSKYFVSRGFSMDDVRDTCFMECLISGKATLYFIHFNAEDHYFIEKDTLFMEIHNDDLLFYPEFTSERFKWRPIEKDELGPRPQKARSSYQYRGVLKALFIDCPEIRPEIDDLRFDRESLIDISKTYHEKICPDEACIVYEKPSVELIWNIGIAASTGIQNFLYDDMYYGGSVVKLRADPPLGMGLVIQSENPDANNRLIFQYAVFYQKYNIDVVTDTRSFNDVHYNIHLDWLKNELSLIYKLRNTHFNPYFRCGVPFSIKLDEEGTISTYTEREFESDQRFMLGITVGAGVEYIFFKKSKLFLLIDYLYSASLDNVLSYSHKIYGLQATVGFLL